MASLARPLRRLAQEGAKFTAVNVVATLLALFIFNLLTHGVGGWIEGSMHDHPLLSYLIANSVGMVVSYLGARHYVFSHRKPMGPLGGAVNYVALNLASFVIPMLCLWISRNVFDLDDALSDNVSGNIIGALCGAVFRFWAFRRFVFRYPDSAGPELRPAEPELVEHQPQQWDADPDDVVRITRHS